MKEPSLPSFRAGLNDGVRMALKIAGRAPWKRRYGGTMRLITSGDFAVGKYALDEFESYPGTRRIDEHDAETATGRYKFVVATRRPT